MRKDEGWRQSKELVVSMAGLLTRDDFAVAAREYIKKHISIKDKVGASKYSMGWHWSEGSNPPFTGHLRRSLALYVPSLQGDGDENCVFDDQGAEENDAGVVTQTPDDKTAIVVQQFIVYSSTWHVPVLHFQAYGSNGHPLNVDQLISIGILAPDDNEGAIDAAQFPRLGIGENPATGATDFYLHPCRTQEAVHLLVNDGASPNGDHAGLLYLEAFIMLCSTAIRMR